MMNRLIFGLDDMGLGNAKVFTKDLARGAFAVKIHDLYHDVGPRVISELKDVGAEQVFLDLKLHDIAKSVANSAKKLKANGTDIVTVHASGGIDMMKAAVDSGLTVYAVTVLTSLTPVQVVDTFNKSVATVVQSLARKAKVAGCHGVICSPQEVWSLAVDPDLKGMEFIAVGSRSDGVPHGDQKRVETPRTALLAGATRLVISSQIIEADDQRLALSKLLSEIRM